MPKMISRPGPRFMYPDLVSSRSLSRCGLVANALWPRLIVQADDQGRLPGDAGSVLVACFPKLLSLVSLDDIETALAELRKAGMILIYRASRETYCQIGDWWRWQQGMRRAYASRFPPPRGWVDVTFGTDGEPTTFAKAAEMGRFVLSGGSRPSAPRPHSARTLPADRPQSAAPARAQGHDPTLPITTLPDPTHSDPTQRGGKPPAGRGESSTNGALKPEQLEEVARGGGAGARAAMRGLEQHWPERAAALRAESKAPATRPRSAS